MRVLITTQIHDTVDGIDLTLLEVGHIYDLGTTVANYLMACGYAMPVVVEPTQVGAEDDPSAV